MKKPLLLVGAICTILCLLALGNLIFHGKTRPVPSLPASPSNTQPNSQPLPTSTADTTPPVDSAPTQGSAPVAVPHGKFHPPTVATAYSGATPSTPAVRQQVSANTGTSRSQTSPRISSSAPASIPQGAAEEVVPVPLGARLPAALVDSATDVTPEQAAVLDNLADDFLNSTTPSASGNGPSPSPKNDEAPGWDPAVVDADERYRSLFGVDAYNTWTSAAAKEALAEKQ